MLKHSQGIALVAVLLLLGATPPASAGEEDASAARIAQLRSDLLKSQSATAALELARMGDPGADALKTALKQDQGRPAALAAWALWQHPNRSLVDALRSILRSKNQVAAYWAARALGAAGDPAAVADLAGLLPKEPNYYWEQAHGKRVILRNREARNVDAPLEAPDDMPNVRAVYAALLALGEIGGPEAELALVEAAGRPLYLIRHAAVVGLGTMKARSRFDLVRRLAQDDPVVIVRDAAREAVAKIEGSWRAPEAPLPPMPDALVFIKTPNRSDANLGFRDSYFVDKTPWYHSGDNLYLLSPVWPPEEQQVRNLTNLTEGAVQGPELSFDGDKILFAMRRNAKTDGFHIFEMNVDGAELRQLTDGNSNDVDPCYLADGRIMFCSDRAGYHEFYHQERSRVLYVVEADGSNVHQVTFNPNQDYEPLALENGFVVYSSYRFYAQDGSPGPVRGERFLQRIETVLRTIRPDGSGDDLFYGAMRGSYFTPIRPTPDSLQYQGKHPRGHLVGVSVGQHREMADGTLVAVTPAGLTRIDPGLKRTDCERPLYPEILNLAGGEEVYI
ncbi:MAG: HEAT repeat domain-containing protein, partial [Planctomycetes bacterium]|nr:HEAT repeat domain-containing protein [Planctomycetota bacterium]